MTGGAILSLLAWPLRKLFDLLMLGLEWMLSDFRHIVITALAVLAVWFWNGERSAAATADRNMAAAQGWKRASYAWKDAYWRLFRQVEKQTAEAEAADRANAARVERAQAQTIERTRNEYEARLADTRAAVEQLRGRISRAGSSAAGDGGSVEPDLPDALQSRCRAFGAADCDALLAALPDQLAAAEDNTAKLIGLQAYVRELLALDWNGQEGAVEREDEGQL